MAVKIVTDSTADIPPQVANELGIGVIPLYVHFGGEVYRDGVDLSAAEFYQKLRSSKSLPLPPVCHQVNLPRYVMSWLSKLMKCWLL